MAASLWEKRYLRERQARQEAEQIAEEKTRELYYRNQELAQLAASLEEKVNDRTAKLKRNNQRLLESHNTLKNQRKKLKESHQKLSEKALELEQTNRHKSQFLANISHELRTPLNSLIILSSLLVESPEGSLTEDQKQSVQMIFNSANELLEVIESILEMSRVEGGELSIHKEDVLLRDIWRSLQDPFSALGREKSIAFEVVCSTDLPGLVHADARRVKQILKNLLSNAFKFTPHGGSVKLLIHKEAWRVGREFSSESLVFQVVDTGCGIPAHQHDAIFQLFRQGDGSSSRKYRGTGLGLAMSRRLTRLMEGDLRLESHEGKGSTFSVILPPSTLVTTAEPDSAGNSSFVIVQEPFRNRTFQSQQILLVDDDLRNSFALSKLLEGVGLTVHLAESGSAALAFLEKNPGIDLILLDLMMPAMDGCQMLKMLRSRVEFRMLPVIMLTASMLKEDEIQCRAAGADDYLCKPIEISLLVDRLATFLGACRT